jgi:CheY-like chemotaxis protein/HPt (histidine-containing phosphotransfer) domain-containing protein
MLAGQAQAWGLLIRDTASGAEALDWIRNGDPFDAAVLAAHISDMDAATLAAEIRKHRDPPMLPLIMLVPLGQHEAGGEADMGSIEVILNTPLKLSQLHATLVSMFDQPPIQTGHAASQVRVEAPPPTGTPLRVLLAEDDTVSQKLLAYLLQKIDCRIDVVGDGRAALQAIERQTYDIALLDVQMPEMDGLVVARSICQHWPKDQRPYMIAVTANALQGDREECLNAGMDDYISKPVREEELIQAIDRCRALPRPITASAVLAPVTAQGADLADAGLAESAPAAIDLPTLGKVRAMLGESAPQLFAELIDTYLNDTSDLLATLHTAVARSDATTLRRAAHKLRSSSVFLGATTLAGLCDEVEQVAGAGTAANFTEWVQRTEAEFARVKDTLLLERAGSSARTVVS